MFMYLPLLNTLIAYSSLGLTVGVMVLAYFLWRRRHTPLPAYLQPYLWPAIILTTIGGVVLSLVYSEIFLFVPCSLCWLQRIALYPQAILAIMAYRRGDTTHFPLYGVALSLFGLGVAVYQYIYQMIPAETRNEFAPCLIDGSNADCAVKVIDMFGFVTFPYVSAVTFALLITLYLSLRRPA